MLTSRFKEALAYAFHLHSAQLRKGSGVPYMAHLLSVCGLVLEEGGDEDQVIAALLHDAAEDQGGAATLAEIRERFGKKVGEMVLACSDSLVSPRPPWRERKEAYIAHLPEAPADSLLVSVADKLHNARCILRDLRGLGEDVWDRFQGGRKGSLWYYRSMAQTLKEARAPARLVAELDRVVTQIEEISGARGSEARPACLRPRGPAQRSSGPSGQRE